MSDKDKIMNLEGDELDAALLAAIDETEEEERAAREQKAQEQRERAEQIRLDALEDQQKKAKIDELRSTLPNEGRRYFLMAEEAECNEDNNDATVTGVMFGTCKKGDIVYLYRIDGRAMGSRVLDIDVYNGNLYEPADEVTSGKTKIRISVDYEKLGFNKETAIPRFSVLTSVEPGAKMKDGNPRVENPALMGLMFRHGEYNKDKNYLDFLMNSIVNGRFLIPAMNADANDKVPANGKKQLKIVMITKKEEPGKRVLPLFTDANSLAMWKELFAGEEKPSVITMSFMEAAKFVSKDKFDIVFNPRGPVSFGLPNKVINAMAATVENHKKNAPVNKQVITDGSKIMVGEPRPGAETDNVRSALISYCRGNSSVNRAGLLYIMKENKLSYLIIVDTPKGEEQAVFAGILAAVKPHLNSVKTVDFSLLSEAAFANDYYKKKEWDYVRVVQ
ncbi:MAG: enhanced serine sensitivity protein SseB C-terminal domain-containing protein [Clostridiales bacterium]|nr:enhanced serine sensitivity protein SseB C-terminal domain-containing protein [Clostridiales bacterium]